MELSKCCGNNILISFGIDGKTLSQFCRTCHKSIPLKIGEIINVGGTKYKIIEENPCDTIEQPEQNEEVGVEQLFNSFCLVGKITTLHADQIKEQLKEFENIILRERTEEIRKELNDMSYNGVLESNEKRRGYDIAITEFLEFLNK